MVVMNEQPKDLRMARVGLGKRQGFANKTSQVLAQGIEPALNMVGLSAFLADRLMAFPVKNALIGVPEIAERVATNIRCWNTSPEWQTTGFATIPDEIGHNLPGAATQGHPYPALVDLLEYKRPQFVQFQRIVQLGFGQGRFQRGQALGPILIRSATVRREMPKTRSMPRRLRRSSTACFTWARVRSS